MPKENPMDEIRDHLVGRPVFPMDEKDILITLCDAVGASCHAIVEERDAFDGSSIRGIAYMAEYVGRRLACYELVPRKEKPE